MSKVSPIAEYLRVNKAIPIRDKCGSHFVSPNGLYLGRLTRIAVDNYKIITLETFGEGLKKMYNKSIAIGQEFAYIKNSNSPIGASIVPVKTYMRRIFIDFIRRTNKIEDSERTLSNKLELIAIDKDANAGLYGTDLPFRYTTEVKLYKPENLKGNLFRHYVN